MRQIAVFHEPNGQITGFRYGTAESVAADVAAGGLALLVDEMPDPASQYVHAGRVVNKPPRPDNEHTFNYDNKQWVRNVPALREEVMRELRNRRDDRLAQSDWTQMPDAPLSDFDRDSWREYRQKLRDLPSEYAGATNFDAIVFPQPPSL